MDKIYRANFVNSLSGIKSANLIGTRSRTGVDNLAIVSSVFHIGANPPLMGVLMRPHSVPRDSLANIKTTKQFTLNHVHSGIAEQAHQTSARYPEDASEFDAVGLTPHYIDGFHAPFVKEARIRIALEVADMQKLDINQTELIIGQIVEVYLDESIVAPHGYLDIEQADSIGVSGLESYHQIKRIGQYPYAKAT
jgi:flavin reductase (DIM6/NTAB) family NADH-FMN oxidoreductase RutF